MGTLPIPPIPSFEGEVQGPHDYQHVLGPHTGGSEPDFGSPADERDAEVRQNCHWHSLSEGTRGASWRLFKITVKGTEPSPRLTEHE